MVPTWVESNERGLGVGRHGITYWPQAIVTLEKINFSIEI